LQFWRVSAFSTSEEFRLEELHTALLESNMYQPTSLYNGSDDSAGKWMSGRSGLLYAGYIITYMF
jgi:ethanolamine utilization protein EutQ (cupin superfamily)